VEITCDTVAFIKQGEVISMRNLHESPEGEVRVTIRALNLSPETLAGLSQWASSINSDGERLTLTTNSNEHLPRILQHLVAGNAEVYEFSPKHLSLEESFLEIMGDERSSE
jgi:ABC-2 type transport system ATP-binding protein